MHGAAGHPQPLCRPLPRHSLLSITGSLIMMPALSPSAALPGNLSPADPSCPTLDPMQFVWGIYPVAIRFLQTKTPHPLTSLQLR